MNPEILCERFFIPEHRKIPLYNQSEKIWNYNKQTIRSIDSNTPLSNFDIIAFTLQYEIDYLNVLWVIDSLGIPFFVKERIFNQKNENNLFPLLIAGGPVLKSNPLAMLPFIDLLIVGDFECIYEDFINILIQNNESIHNFNQNCVRFIINMLKSKLEINNSLNLNNSNDIIIPELIKLPNIIISFFTLIYLEYFEKKKFNNSFESDSLIKYLESYLNINLFNNLEYLFDKLKYFPIKQVFLEDLSNSPPSLRQIIPEFEDPSIELIFGKSLLIESDRGCPFKCNFCITGHLYGNFRIRNEKNIKEVIDNGLIQTPVSKITFISSSILSNPNISNIFKYLISRKISFTVPSIRIDLLNQELLDLIYDGGMRSLTIAPETGSDRLRKIINKNITNNQIIEKIKLIFKKDFNGLKLYFLIGLPEENFEDIQAIINLIKDINNEIQKQNLIKKINIRISINIFIPKLQTPFGNYLQNFEDMKMTYLHNISNNLAKELKKFKNINVEIMDPKTAFIQCFLSQIDESFGNILYEFYVGGGKFSVLKKIIIEYKDKFERFFDENGYNERISKIKSIL